MRSGPTSSRRSLSEDSAVDHTATTQPDPHRADPQAWLDLPDEVITVHPAASAALSLFDVLIGMAYARHAATVVPSR